MLIVAQLCTYNSVPTVYTLYKDELYGTGLYANKAAGKRAEKKKVK